MVCASERQTADGRLKGRAQDHSEVAKFARSSTIAETVEPQKPADSPLAAGSFDLFCRHCRR